MIHRAWKRLAYVVGVAGLGCGGASAQGPPGMPSTTVWTPSFSMAPVHQFEAGLDGGGDVSISSFLARFDIKCRVNPIVELGLGIRYDYDDYAFSGLTRLGGQNPWHAVHRVGVRFSASTGFADRYTLLIAPSIDYSGASGASVDDALSYGAVLSVSRFFSPRLIIGIGGGVYQDLEEVNGFPFLMVRWQVTDRLRLANPFRPGPTGPAGIELVYDLGTTWEAAVGGVWRSTRFRLDDNAAARGGIAENDGLPVFLRVSRISDDTFSVDAYAGAMLEGDLTLEDRRGNEIRSDDYDTVPFLGLAVSKTF